MSKTDVLERLIQAAQKDPFVDAYLRIIQREREIARRNAAEQAGELYESKAN